MKNQYCMTSESFDLRVSEGALASIHHACDPQKTEFVLPEAGFAQLQLCYRTPAGQATPFAPCEEEELAPLPEGRDQTYIWRASDANLTVQIQFALEGARLRQQLAITNRTASPLRLRDLGLRFPCNSKFDWGIAAGEKVIGHHFIGGEGSHLLLTRADGAGPYLLFLPQAGTGFTFYDEGSKEAEPEAGLIAYVLAEGRASLPENQGSRRVRLPQQGRDLLPGETYTLHFAYVWARDESQARDQLVANGLVDVQAAPGLTVERGVEARLYLRCAQALSLEAAFPDSTDMKVLRQDEQGTLYGLRFAKLGENALTVRWGKDCAMPIEYFVTEPIPVLLEKRGAFLEKHQIRDDALWYDGLFAEWNNESGATLSPGNYDRIGGWRIYEVSCDDPGLAKPAFLASKNAALPVQAEVDALDRYIEKFVWGGLQCTDQEAYPYAIYGIPDWHKNRYAEDPGNSGRSHLWRIYDYPHIAMLYYQMYRVASDYRHIHTKLSADTYLTRAYGTALAMFTVPLELDQWSAYKTGLYNEWVIPEIVAALRQAGRQDEALRLDRHWQRKVQYFVCECKDVFGSEYPFDTTGFESTQVLAREGLRRAQTKMEENRWAPPMLYKDAKRFLDNQMRCNIACRGTLEPAYFWYGSDYRSNNYHYTLSYMSQMGGAAILDYALYNAEDPFPLLRLAYGSLQSAWALLNSGDKESNWGYWFPGEANDGAASGGFEPLPSGQTWLDQPHRGGAWYYSCEIDLGFCGALHGAATVLALDPLLGTVAYGGRLQQDSAEGWRVACADGLYRRFHVVTSTQRVHICLDRGHFDGAFAVSRDAQQLCFAVDTSDLPAGFAELRVSVDVPAAVCVDVDGVIQSPDAHGALRLPAGKLLQLRVTCTSNFA